MSENHLKLRYADRFGIEMIVPQPKEQDFVDRIIFDELCRGQFKPASKAACLDLIDKLHAEGAEGIVLGCTEIPLLIRQQDRPELPLFDTAGLHVSAALAMALD
jgi:aspartate racemase